MPISPTIAEDLAAGVVEHYAEAERILLARIAKSLAKGIDGPRWAEEKLVEVHAIQSRAQGLLSDLHATAAKSVGDAVTTAWDRGLQVADADLVGVLDKALNPITSSMPGSRSLTHLVTETTGRVVGTHLRILRSTMDLYRSVVAQASGQILLGTQTRREVAQAALDTFAQRGVTGLIDRAGHGWDMSSYVDMAVRTSTSHAAVAAHVDRLQEAGQDLVIVSNAPQECSRCRPWEGKILSLSGSAVGTEAVATLSEATGAGLFHPNCRHSTGLYQPGITKPLIDTEDPQGDADRQKLRYLERQVRAEKRKQAVALDPVAARKAELRIRARQAQIREHVATTSAKRQPDRERLGRGKPPTPPPLPPVSVPSYPGWGARESRLVEAASRTPETKGQAGKMLASGTLTREDAKGLLKRGLDFTDEKSGLRVEISEASVSHRIFLSSEYQVAEWNFSVKNPEGAIVGKGNRYLLQDANGGLSVEHDFFKLDRGVRGTGFASRWSKHAEDWYASQGLGKVTLSANIDVGGYAWARQGFDWAQPSSILQPLDRILRATPEGSPLRDKMVKLQQEMVGRVYTPGVSIEAFPTPYELSQIGYTEGATMWPGKEGMLGSSWKGVKHLVPVP